MVAGSVATSAAVGAGWVAAGSLGAALIGGAVSMAVGAAFADKPDTNQNPGQLDQEVTSRMVTVRQAVAPWQWIYGQVRVGGILTFMEEDADGYLHLVITMAGHPCEELGDLYFDNELVTLDGSGSAANATGKYADHVYVEKSLGTEAAGVQPFSNLVNVSDGKWTSAHCQTGRTKLWVRLKFNQDLFPNGIPNISCVVKGRKCYDPRNSPGSSVWTVNPVLCTVDYLTHAQVGPGATYATEIDEALLISAANACDESVTLAGSPTTTEQRYQMSGAFAVNATPRQVLGRLLTAVAGNARFLGGKWSIVPAVYSAPTVTLTADDLRAPLRIQPRLSRRDLANAVKGIFVSPDNNWQPSDFPPVTNATYYAEDNNERIWRELDLPFTISSATAQRIAKIELERVRQQITVTWPGKLTCYRVQPGDTVQVTLDRYGWSSKVFEVATVALTVLDDGVVGCDLVLRETASTVYDWSAGEETVVDLAPDSNLPDMTVGLTVTLGSPRSGTSELFVAGDGTVFSRIGCSFTAPSSPYIDRYQVQYARSAGSPQEWQDAPSVLYGNARAYFYPVEEGVAYDGRVRAVTTLGNAGAWSYFYAHTVIGKTEVPSDISGFSAVQQGATVLFDTDRATDADLDSIEIRFIEVGGTWANASPLCNILRGETATSAAVPPGTWDMLAKAKDTSGNYSTNEARATLSVTAEGFTSISAREQAPNWLGMTTNMVRHWTGKLTPESQTLAANMTDAQLWDEFVYNAYTDCYYEAPVADKSIDATSRIWADIVSVLGPGETAGTANPRLEIDYRLAAGSFDGFEMWSIGSANFRYLKARIHVDTTLGKPVISGFEVNIDNQARTEEFRSQSIGSSGTAITFTTPFHATPVISITPIGTTALIPSAESPSTTGFTAHLYNTAGAGASGSADIRATGP